eukprot:TRINITY_DN82450_c0_g1_i1.p1 TRINITY_DN82450_c0_g1~~TRINITY_DN82450_c0_g1_i1.p1  ORF type:complete len:354 (+),score=72.66 TRINITY_DN82450_c0_g1_i1:92-1063(+)
MALCSPPAVWLARGETHLIDWAYRKEDCSHDFCSTGLPSPELAPGTGKSPALSWSQLDFSSLRSHAETDFRLPDAHASGVQQPWSIFAAEEFLGEPEDRQEGTLQSAQYLEQLVESLFDECDAGVAAATPDCKAKWTEVPKSQCASGQSCTTAMLRNLPNKYMRDKLVARLHECGFKGDIDFLYLPIDFRNKCNVGYCFINFRTEKAYGRFKDEFHGMQSGRKLPGFNSKKVLEVSPARVQGLQPNILRLQGSPVMTQVEGEREWLPVLLDETGRLVDFPMFTPKADEALPIEKGYHDGATGWHQAKSQKGIPRRRYRSGVAV